MKTNELRKGTRVKLACGWRATIEDNKKGNIRLATVEGIVTEMGSVYSHNIMYYLEGSGNTGKWRRVEHTPAQVKLRKTVNSFDTLFD